MTNASNSGDAQIILTGKSITLDVDFGNDTSGTASAALTINTNCLLVMDIPQGQVAYSKVDVDDFTEFKGERVSIGDEDRVTARVAISVHKKAQEEEKLLGYALSNLYYRLNEDTQMNINNLSLDTQTGRLFGDVSLRVNY